MNKIWLLFLTLSIACQAQTPAPNLNRRENPLTAATNQKNELAKIEKYTNLFDFRVLQNSLTQNGYTLERQFKTHPDLADKGQTVEYAVMQKNGKTVLRFDRLAHPLSATDFGLFSFLGKTSAQIFISQSAPRTGCHWIISTKPGFRVLFESAQFDVGREDFEVLDIDGDGVYELSFESISFYNFELKRLGSVGVPLTEIIFKYNSQTDSYVPANPFFANFALREIETQKAQIRRDDANRQLADVLAITLRYIYAGREPEAWDFFDKEYNLKDQADLKMKIKSVLSSDRTYQYIYKKQ